MRCIGSPPDTFLNSIGRYASWTIIARRGIFTGLPNSLERHDIADSTLIPGAFRAAFAME
jgi:hypothetical protein